MTFSELFFVSRPLKTSQSSFDSIQIAHPPFCFDTIHYDKKILLLKSENPAEMFSNIVKYLEQFILKLYQY